MLIMKYIFTILIGFFTILNLSAQSLSFSYISEDSVSGDVFTELETKATVQNTSATQNTYLVERFELSMVPGHTSYFCWSIDCYPPNVDLSTSTVVLAPNAKDSTFVGYLTPYDATGGIEGTSVVKYVFFNQNNPADSISAVFIYTATQATTGIKTRVLGKDDFYAFPNPSSNELNIAFGDITSYSNARIIIRNALGSEMINNNISTTLNLSKIDVSRLERGVYFYTIQLDGQNVHTKKFAVAK